MGYEKKDRQEVAGKKLYRGYVEGERGGGVQVKRQDIVEIPGRRESWKKEGAMRGQGETGGEK